MIGKYRRHIIFGSSFFLVCVLVFVCASVFYPQHVRDGIQGGRFAISGVKDDVNENINFVALLIEKKKKNAFDFLSSIEEKAVSEIVRVHDVVQGRSQEIFASIEGYMEELVTHVDGHIEQSHKANVDIEVASNDLVMNDANDFVDVVMLNDIEPAVSGNTDSQQGEFVIDETVLNAEAVLVPREKTVISSSRDGKIAKINFDNGDTFKKGDILLEYSCFSVQAEVDAAVAQNRFAREKTLITNQLYDLDLVSKLERLESQVERKKATAGKVVTESKYNDCVIRANYDGRVVKRLANPNEYTRTDRVLMEVASQRTLDAEFLLPSISLRWVNVGAPIALSLHETGKSYVGRIKRIYGEVDPVSQSIQIRAEMDPYDHPLLPGMSGEVTVNMDDVQNTGIKGFLETGTL